MSFENERFKMTKEFTMTKLQNAIEKKVVDEVLVKYLLKYNKLKETYTTSSCAGRILVLGLDEQETKKPKLFVGKWHRVVKLKEVLEKLNEDKFPELWLKQEPFIFHIVAKNIKIAEKILQAKKDAGIKRGGIINLKDGKIVVEILGSNYMSLPVKKDGKIMFNKRQLGFLVRIANRKVKKNYKQLWKFLRILYKEMKSSKKIKK